MNILVVAGLGDQQLIRKLKQFDYMQSVGRVYVVRRQAGPKLDKVEYVTPLVKVTVLSHVNRLLSALWVLLTKRVDVVVSYYLEPHGVIGFFAAKLTGKLFVNCLIGCDLNNDIRTSPFSGLHKWILARSDVLCVRGTNSKKILLDMGYPEENIFMPKNWVDVDKFAAGEGDREYDLIYVGRLSPEKNPLSLLDILYEVKAKKPDATLCVLGDGELMEEFKKKTLQLGLEDNVELKGWVDNPEDYIKKSRVLLITSMREGKPSAIIEAMLAGTVPVAPDIGDITDLCDETNSIILKQFDVKEYANEIMKLLGDEKQFKRLSENARKIRDEYSTEKVIGGWDGVFQHLGVT